MKTTIHLPMPPSVNRIWRSNKAGKRMVSRSPLYREWIQSADDLSLVLAQLRGIKRIPGRFTAEITLPFDDRGQDPPFDIDNRIKGVLDWAQSRELVVNDRRAMAVNIKWGKPADAPYGCKLELTGVSS